MSIPLSTLYQESKQSQDKLFAKATTLGIPLWPLEKKVSFLTNHKAHVTNNQNRRHTLLGNLPFHRLLKVDKSSIILLQTMIVFYPIKSEIIPQTRNATEQRR